MWLRWAIAAGLFVSLFMFLYSLFMTIRMRNYRWKQYKRWMDPIEGKVFLRLKRLFRIYPSDRHTELKQLLILSGIQVHADSYLLMKRFMLMIISGFALSLLIVQKIFSVFSIHIVTGATLTCLCLALLFIWDKPIFESLKKRRSRKIVNEIYVLSRQLLYYSSSKMNLHVKLTRCYPHAHVLKRELQWLLREWFEGPEAALQRFKRRIGTEEGYSFVETLNAIRLNDSEHYYHLLKQRIADYKEKMELHRESRKETTSYLLFVMAGIPIMNTFRVFIYPWVNEGQKLLNMLN